MTTLWARLQNMFMDETSANRAVLANAVIFLSHFKCLSVADPAAWRPSVG